MHDSATFQHKHILVVEDNLGHCELLKEALVLQGFEGVSRIEHRSDRALAFLEARASSPHPHPLKLILLDLKLKEESGLEFLHRLKRDARFATIPVVMLTTSDDPQDIQACYTAGANGYVVKPDTFDHLVTLVGDLSRYWLTWNRCDK